MGLGSPVARSGSGNQASDRYNQEPRDVVVAVVSRCNRQVLGDRRRSDPRVIDRHSPACIPQHKAEGRPGVGDSLVGGQGSGNQDHEAAAHRHPEALAALAAPDPDGARC